MPSVYFFFFFNDTATTEIYTLSLHDALPILLPYSKVIAPRACISSSACTCSPIESRSEEHTSELQSLRHLVCRLLLEKKKSTRSRKAKCSSRVRPTASTASLSALMPCQLHSC